MMSDDTDKWQPLLGSDFALNRELQATAQPIAVDKIPPTLSLFSPAKINLFLHITGKRDDGYHNLQTIFRLLDWGDTLHFYTPALPLADKYAPPLLKSAPLKPAALDTPSNSDNSSIDTAIACDTVTANDMVNSGLIGLHGACAITKNPADNLIIKAATALYNHVTIYHKKSLPHLTPITISINKKIPMGAGLGGGSSNAATTLLALNTLWQLHLSQTQLIQIAKTVGADVPIFILGKNAIGEGIGEVLTPISLPPQHYLLLFPDAHISTKDLFSHTALKRNTPPLMHADIISQQSNYLQQLRPPFNNVFEPVVTQLSSKIKQALNYLYECTHALTQNTQLAVPTPRLTGSGSTVFLPLPEPATDRQEDLQHWLDNAPCAGKIVAGL